MNPRTPSRVPYLDVLKAYAILLVVFTHVAGPVFYGYGYIPPLTWGLFNVLNAAVRICVPLFIMVSGKLIIGAAREETPFDYLRRRLPPILIPFAVWSIIYAFIKSQAADEPFVLLQAIRTFINEPTEFHLWFMYMIVAVYLIAPLLRTFARAARPVDLGYVLGLWFMFLALQYYFPSFDSDGPAGTVVCFGGYFLLGYALDRMTISPALVRKLLAIPLIIIAGTSVAAFRLTRAGGLPEQFYYGYLYPLIVVHAAIIFLAARTVDWNGIFNRHLWFSRAVTRLSFETFNVYLIHVMFIRLWDQKVFGFQICTRTGGTALIGVPATLIAVTLSSLALSAVLQHIPVLSRLLVIRPPQPKVSRGGTPA